ncbi:MAG: LysM peptidoglycan-binding domain-containing protein [Woeseia sp.]
MEQPLIMCPVKIRINTRAPVFATALAVLLAGCSLNPFSSDDGNATGVTPASQPESRPTSITGSSQSQSQPAYTPPPARQQLTQIPLASGHPDEYVVQRGDTLWDIAATFLKDPWYWPEVWYVNPQVENPHLIYPGDVLALVMIDGQPRITTVSGSAYRLSPQARITPLDEAITSIPYDQIAAFLSRGLVLERSQIEQLPYVLSTRGDHLIAAAGNDIYVRGGDPAPAGTQYSVVHIGDELRDPDDGSLVGYQGIYVGEGSLTRGGDPATLALTDSNRETRAGDRLLPESADIPLNFFPKAPDSAIDGRIISVVDGVALIGQYQVIVMNRGARDGLAPGDILTVFQAGEVIRDRFANGGGLSGGLMSRMGGGEKVTLPDEQAGTVMVFKVYDRIAYGLVMEATSDIHILDAVRSPE